MGETTTALRPLDANALHPGLKLPGHIYNPRGRIVKRAGSVLNSEHIELLRSQGSLMVDGDWPSSSPSPPAEEPIAQIIGDVKAEKLGAERRRYKRHRWEAALCLKVEEHTRDGTVARELSVKASDLSQAGFSFIFSRPLANGSIVYVQFDDLPRRPRVKGIVRNSLPLQNGTYRLGVEFLVAAREK